MQGAFEECIFVLCVSSRKTATLPDLSSYFCMLQIWISFVNRQLRIKRIAVVNFPEIKKGYYLKNNSGEEA